MNGDNLKNTNYNYRDSEAYAKGLGLVWRPDWVEDFDQQAKAFSMTQAQVDMCLQHHLTQVRHLFRPQAYTWKQRIALALFFLLGRKK